MVAFGVAPAARNHISFCSRLVYIRSRACMAKLRPLHVLLPSSSSNCWASRGTLFVVLLLVGGSAAAWSDYSDSRETEKNKNKKKQEVSLCLGFISLSFQQILGGLRGPAAISGHFHRFIAAQWCNENKYKNIIWAVVCWFCFHAATF